MQLTTIFAAILVTAASVNAAPSVEKRAPEGHLDFFSNGGCAGTPCLEDFALQTGCNVVPAGCSTSGWITDFVRNCTVTIWTNRNCSSVTNFIAVNSLKDQLHCESPSATLGIQSVSVSCP